MSIMLNMYSYNGKVPEKEKKNMYYISASYWYISRIDYKCVTVLYIE